MGLVTGYNCERCGEQVSYEGTGYQLKSDGDDHDFCPRCAHIVAFDKKNKEE